MPSFSSGDTTPSQQLRELAKTRVEHSGSPCLTRRGSDLGWNSELRLCQKCPFCVVDDDDFGLNGARPTKAKSSMTMVYEMRRICNKGTSLKNFTKRIGVQGHD